MTDIAQELLDILDIEQLEVDLFRGTGSNGETSVRIFGGQVIGQALAAAYRTVPDRLCHSLHAYFIRPGNPEYPVVYQVDRARDGGSFTTRRIVALQNGKQIFNMSASFQVAEEGWDHQHQMPNVAGPEGLKTRAQLRESIVHKIPEKLRSEFLRPRPIEVREVDPRDMVDPAPQDDQNHTWIRLEAARGQGPQMQHCLLAYASDMSLLGSSLLPHGLTWVKGGVMMASLDHAMWFHAPIQFEDWHLYSMDAPFTGGARGFTRGTIYNQNGQMVASVAQEGLLRPFTKRS